MNYWLIFLTGLTTGGLSCVAVQGGLLAGVLANQKREGSTQVILPTVLFMTTKILAYTVLGGLLGYFGSVAQLTTTARIWFQIIAAIFMLGLAANMFEIHPIFRYFVIQPPKWVGKLLRNQTKSQNLYAPAILGLFTVLIPCGVTQAMEVSAIASGNVFSGALTMLFFILGTAPMFLLVGYLTTKLSDSFRRNFTKTAAFLVIFVALTSLNGALVLSDSKYSFDKWVWAFQQTFMPQKQVATSQNITMVASGTGYSPNRFSVKAGEAVNLTIETNKNFSCSSIFTIPSLDITKTLPSTGKTLISFVPAKAGPMSFTCGMGMYTGVIDVI